VKPLLGRRISKFKIGQLTISLEEHLQQLEVDLVRLYRKDVKDQKYVILAAANDHIHPLLQSFYSPEEVRLEVDEKEAQQVGLLEGSTGSWQPRETRGT
jgi:hypothetical protein